MAFNFTLDRNSVVLVGDGAGLRILGTAFAFLRGNWFVTAKHVVVIDDIPREDLLICPMGTAVHSAIVLFAHPLVDLAVLECREFRVDRPLFPGHEQFIGRGGLICAGYAPSRREKSGKLEVLISFIESYERETRSRNQLDEETILFDAPFSEGGHSGGPIFGEGGGVVGVTVEQVKTGDGYRARATSILPLLGSLHFR